MTYFIVLAKSLDGIPKSWGEYDLSFFEKYDTEYIELSHDDFVRMGIDLISIKLFTRYGFLIGDGDYAYLDDKDCVKLKDYLINDYDGLIKYLDKDVYHKLIEFCDYAINNKTGIAFIF